MPLLIEGTRVHVGAPLALLVVLVAWVAPGSARQIVEDEIGDIDQHQAGQDLAGAEPHLEDGRDQRIERTGQRGENQHCGWWRAPICSAPPRSCSWVVLRQTVEGFAVRLVGAAPKAARFAGFDSDRLVLVTFAASGALAGLAGIIEVAGPIGHLQPNISPGYGFTAIIVAFLGRLHPVGILVAGLFLALTFIGGEGAQISLKVPLDLTKAFQGILLFFVLACDSLSLHRIRLVRSHRKVAHAG
jgi:hypothetical protein